MLWGGLFGEREEDYLGCVYLLPMWDPHGYHLAKCSSEIVHMPCQVAT